MQIEIFSDVVCPWCYIGTRRLQEALSTFPHADDVTITYRSYQLDPTAPRHPEQTLDEMLAAKYGRTLEQARAMNDQVTDVAATVGLDFHLENAHPANTFDAHRLLHLALHHGKQIELKERLLLGYFSQGLRVSDHEALAAAAVDVGLPDAEVREVLAGDRYSDDVRADIELARGFGATGVPFFVVDRTYGISGAQESAVFSDVLERAWTDSHPAPLVTTSGDAPTCTDGSCEVPRR